MDLYDDEDSPNIYAMLELPGVDRNTLSLRVLDRKLVIHGERASPLSKKLMESAQQNTSFPPDKYKIRELKFGSFHRELDIPAGIDVRTPADSPRGFSC